MLHSPPRQLLAFFVSSLLVLAACGGDDSPDEAGTQTDDESTSSTSSPEASDQSEGDGSDSETEEGEGEGDGEATADAEGSAGADGSSDDADTDDQGDRVDGEPDRIDWLTFARGMTFVSLTGLQGGSANDALFAVNGDPTTYGVTTDDNTVEFVFELPAVTTLDRLAVPNVLDRPGNDTAVRFLTVEGSAEGPDTGWQVLADTEFELHDEAGQLTELELLTVTPIRWLRLTMNGGVLVEPGDEGRTTVRFSELIGNGTQEPIEEPSDFGGLWEFDLTERTDFNGDPLQIIQTGSSITGCWGDINFSGSVNGVIARATGVDPVRGNTGSFIFVADVDDGAISALVSFNNGFFKPFVTTDNPEIEGCLEEEAPEPVVCETSVYINFDLNSDAIRPESTGVLADLYDRLVADGTTSVSIVGHTSTEGDASYNLDLSQRRAQAVVDDLVGRGFDPAGIAAEGRGESEPLISPDDTETARELNRRVGIAC